MKPENPSRNSKNYLVYCQINDDRRIALKRCSDIPDFIRREITTAEAHAIVGFPSYKVIRRNGIISINKSSGKNFKLQ